MENKLPFEKIQRELIAKRKSETSPKYGADPNKRETDTLISYGVVNIDKPKGPTSHQVSAYVQQILGLNKAGHSGTLDPHVTGVLPIALGRATRISQYLLKSGKEYVGIMHIHKDIDVQLLQKTVSEFVGKIMQLPPIKSAVKRQLRERNIYYFEILEIDEKDVLFRVGCQAGTYIRKLCLHPDTDILTPKGFIQIKNLYSQPQPLYSMNQGKLIERIPSKFQKISSPKRLVRLTMSSGVRLAVTSDHELLKSFDDKYRMVEAGKLNKGDFLVKSLFVPDTSTNYLIPNLLDDYYLVAQPEIKKLCKRAFIRTYGSIRAMNKNLKLDRKVFLSKSENAITLKHLKLAGIYEKLKIKIHTFKTQKGKIIRMNKLSPDHFYLLGLVASDGNNTKEKNTKRYTRIKFHNKNETLINIFLETYKRLFPTVGISRKEVRNGLFQLDTSNSLFATVAASLGIVSPQKYSDILPILNARKELIISFLRGYFDGDGTTYYKKKINMPGHYTDIRLYSVNYTTAKRIHQMLLKLGIHSKIFTRKPLYIVSLKSLASKLKFIKEVGTNHPNKKKIFDKIVNLGKNKLSEEFHYVGLHYKKYIKNNKSRLHDMGGNLNRIITSQIPITRSFYKKASKLAELPPLDEFAIEKITRVEHIIFKGFVYDITIPQTHNFLVETGFVSSNCHDLGQKLGCGAHMTELRRTKAAAFDETSLHSLQDLADAFYYYKNEGNDKYLRKIILPIESAIAHIPRIWVHDTTVESLCHGANLKNPGISRLDSGIEPEDDVAILTLKGELICIGRAKLHSKEMLQEKGITVSVDSVFMEPGTYPKVEKKN